MFLDNTESSGYTAREYGYLPAYNKSYVNVSANRGRNRSLLCAISKNSVIGYEVREDSYNGIQQL